MRKLLFLASLLIFNNMSFGQGYCSLDHPVFNTDGNSSPKAVYRLGTDPEFPFLRNLSTPQQVLHAMNSKANAKKYPRQMHELNRMLVEIGFDNGVNDVKVSNIKSYTVSRGTTGNMGDGKLKYEYVKLETGGRTRGWKVTQGGKCDIVFLSKCGNAFYPYGAENSGSYTGNQPCKDVDVALTAEPKEVTVDAEDAVTKKVYVFYRKCNCDACGPSWSQKGYDDGLLSKPLLVKKEKASSETYKVTAANNGQVRMCGGRPTGVTADLQVEKENEYTGDNPNATKEYIQVSRGEYRRMKKNKELMRELEDRPHMEECTTCQ